MTLDDRIKKDLDDLYNKGEIDGAKALDGLITAKNGQTSFATKALPCYYWGDRSAKTVLVMLNPGEDVNKANNNLKCELDRRSMKNAADITMYNDWSVNYGHYDKNRHDNFDLKQAFFLREWKNTGISLPQGLCAQSTKQMLLSAKESVLVQKLQLELIPYASSSFSNFVKSKISSVLPFVETLLDEIFSQEREYIIFCSRKFEGVFRAFNILHPGTVNFKCKCSQKIPHSKLNGSCTVIAINYKGKSANAIIANTFPSQALSNAYEKMAAYGEFCYKCLLEHLP